MSVCQASVTKGPLKGLSARGTEAGYVRHRRADETPCADCFEGHRRLFEQYRQDHPEQVRRNARRSYWRNTEAAAARARRFRELNPGYGAESMRKYREDNPEWHRNNQQKRRARQRGSTVTTFTPADLDARMSMFGYRCWMCGGPFEHVDHVKPLSKGGPHALANLRPACAPCNTSKGDRWPL